MPIYEFNCRVCAYNYEEIVSSHVDTGDAYSNTHPVCPLCGGASKKIISASSFVINGFNEKNGYSRSSARPQK
jgi:putative FmdB family regulatory protein